MKDINLANAYQQVIDEYLENGYILHIPKEEPKPEAEWFLPHSKVRIVFDASAKCEGKSLNTEALPGPKLHGKISEGA